MLSPGLRPVYEAGTAGRPWVTHRQHWWGPGQGQPTGGLKEQSQGRRALSPSPKRESQDRVGVVMGTENPMREKQWILL